jgi:hydroxylysine kinase
LNIVPCLGYHLCRNHNVVGIIHGDFNEQNIIVRPSDDVSEDEPVIEGVIDFGDAILSPYVFDLATTIMYLMLDSHVVDPLEVGGHIMAGYLSRRSLTLVDRAALRTCLAARYAQSLTMGTYSYMMDPDNEYLLASQSRGWPLLRRIWEMPAERLDVVWNTVLAAYGL